VIYIGFIFLFTFLILLFLRHQMMDKVQKHNSLNIKYVWPQNAQQNLWT